MIESSTIVKELEIQKHPHVYYSYSIFRIIIYIIIDSTFQMKNLVHKSGTAIFLG